VHFLKFMDSARRPASPVRTIYTMRFLLAFAQGGLLSPLLPLLRETFRVSPGELGLLTSMSGLSSVVMDVIATYLAHHGPSFIQLLPHGVLVELVQLLLNRKVLLFRKGKVVRKVREDQIVDALIEELDAMEREAAAGGGGEPAPAPPPAPASPERAAR